MISIKDIVEKIASSLQKLFVLVSPSLSSDTVYLAKRNIGNVLIAIYIDKISAYLRAILDSQILTIRITRDGASAELCTIKDTFSLLIIHEFIIELIRKKALKAKDLNTEFE